jgi:hypothetical protein
MSQRLSFDDLFNAVLVDSNAQSLSDAERNAIEAVFGSLAAVLSSSTVDSPDWLTSATGALGLNDLFDCRESDMSIPLNEQSDEFLVVLLSHHVESASAIVEELQQRSMAGQYHEPLRQLELQFVATSVNIEVLQAGITSTPDSCRRWWKRLKQILLYEFDFINRWFR